MAQNLTSRLVLELIDRVTGPAKSAMNAVTGLRRTAEGAGGGFTSGLTAAIERNNQALDRARVGLIDAAGSFYAIRAAIGAPLAAAASFEGQLEDIGQKADIPQERLGALGEKITEVARVTGQAASQVAEGVDQMVGAGASVDTALAAAAPINRAAVAYNAATEDLAATVTTAVQNLGIPATEAEKTLDVLAQAGKEGAFELRDLAQYLPSLASAYASTGATGVEGLAQLSAAAQVVRKDTGDASTAATRLQNVIQKTYSPATVKKFADRGIDLLAEMEAAAKRGLDPLEAIAEITNKALGGDLTKLGSLFEDSEAQAGVRSLIAHQEEYRRIRAEALKAQGVVATDFARRSRTARGATMRFTAAIENLSVTLGAALIPALNSVLDRVVPLIANFADWAGRNSELVGTIVSAVAGLIAFRGAMAALTFVGLLGRGGALALLATGMSTVGVAGGKVWSAVRSSIALQTALARMDGTKVGLFAKLAAGLRGLAAVTGLSSIAGGIGALVAAIAAISAPVWLGIAAAVAAVGLAWKYWDRASAFIAGVGSALGDILAPAIDAIRPALDWLAPIGEAIATGWEKAKTAIADVGGWLGSLFGQEVLSDEDKAAARQAGYDFIMAIWTGMKRVATDLIAWAADLGDRLLDPIREWKRAALDLLPGFGSSGGASGFQEDFGVPPARAKGGPISRGNRYLVGENGPELITASRSGYVHPTGSGGGGGGSVTVNNSFTINGGRDDAETIASKVAAKIEASAREAMRGLYADTGLRAY